MDKYLMEGILWNTKNLCTLCLTGAEEAATPEVHNAFFKALKVMLEMQNDVFNEMSSHNFYEVTQVEKTKISETKSKFTSEFEGELFIYADDEYDIDSEEIDEY